MLDLGFMAYDHQTGDCQAFYLDAMALMIPGVTGLGMLSHADELYDGYRLLNSVDNISDSRYAINYTDNWIDDAACFNSFSADTTVVTDKGDIPISQIQIGDFVLAWNAETNEITFELVTDTIHHTDEVVVYLTIDGEEIETTPEHPFYVEGAGWTDAEDLQLGDEIRNADGEKGEVESITIEEVTQEMYNLTVDEAHTFFVGDGQWLVHNKNCLVVGEGSFEYSWNLYNRQPSLNIMATSYESFYNLEQIGFSLPSPNRGFSMMENIDARVLGNYFPSNSFDVAIFNNPHILVPQNPRQTGILTAGLISDFLESAPSVLRTHGEIHINLTNSVLRHDPVVTALSGSSIQQRFGNSEFYAPYVARYTNGNPFPSWYPERSSTLLNLIFRP